MYCSSMALLYQIRILLQPSLTINLHVGWHILEGCDDWLGFDTFMNRLT